MRLLPSALALLAAPALAEVPQVATDIAPVQSLVAQVMGELGAPVQVLPPGASPHDHALRPSEAAALERADLVVWVGPELTPGLGRALDSLGAGAVSLPLLAAEGTTLRAFAEEAHEEGHDDDHEEDHEEHDEHEDHGAHDDDDDHGHHHEGTDPHAWLAPQNGAVWLEAIADSLSALDPENEATYRANAAAGAAAIAEATEVARARLAPVAGARFVTFHDAYGYYTEAFALADAGAISLGDGAAPGPARLAALRAEVTEGGIACVFTEPAFDPGLAETLLDGTEAGTAVLDPLGGDLEPGAGLYPALILDLAEGIAGCLEG
ncbi:zinc ABC transporter substrate-binding protein [Pseudoroseicyclus sp. CXY001]|uniref:zinc ABC transporter substrate-binding protein n=1 Tax=Pseudoroseicyclus sp. CXY001 TaxID=3242492 RepID=UPI003570A49B